MPRRKTIITLLFLLAFALGAWAQAPATGTRTQSSQDRYTAAGHLRKPSKFSGVPADGTSQPPAESSADQAYRQKREAHYATLYGDVFKDEIADPGAGGEVETTHLMIYDYAGDISTLPARTSAAVVIGTVVGGKAFLTKDHKYVYSDYQIRVDQILKQDVAANITVGGQLVAYRPGGTIHFPSGHIRHFANLGQGHPIVGAQYLFFLGRPDLNIREYQMTLFATYELKNAIVYPLDDANGQFEGISQSVLLDRTVQLIADSKNGGLQ